MELKQLEIFHIAKAYAHYVIENTKLVYIFCEVKAMVVQQLAGCHEHENLMLQAIWRRREREGGE